jgi:hypothetical protein
VPDRLHALASLGGAFDSAHASQNLMQLLLQFLTQLGENVECRHGSVLL